MVLRKSGYETLKTHRKLKAPLLGIPPLDLFGEFFGAKDRQEWNFELKPQREEAATPQDIIARGETLKVELESSEHTCAPLTQPSTRPSTQPTSQPAWRDLLGR